MVLCKALQHDVRSRLQGAAAGRLNNCREACQAQGCRGVLVRDQRQQLSVRLLRLLKLRCQALDITTAFADLGADRSALVVNRTGVCHTVSLCELLFEQANQDGPGMYPLGEPGLHRRSCHSQETLPGSALPSSGSHHVCVEHHQQHCVHLMIKPGLRGRAAPW